MDRADSCTLVDAIGQSHEVVKAEGTRIVSLVPSLTELLFDLGLGEQLVGRTGFCVRPRNQVRRVPKLGGTKDVRLDKLRALAPTHVIVNVDENTRETAEALAGFVPNVIVTHPCSPADNIGLYRLLGGIFGREPQADKLSAELTLALREATRLREALTDEAVLYLIWREPWMTVSPDTYISTMLASVGWITAPSEADSRYPAFDWRAAWLSGVSQVFLSSEPYRFQDRHVAEVELASGKRAMLIDGEMVSWYGSRAIAGVRYLTALRRRHSKS